MTSLNSKILNIKQVQVISTSTFPLYNDGLLYLHAMLGKSKWLFNEKLYCKDDFLGKIPRLKSRYFIVQKL